MGTEKDNENVTPKTQEWRRLVFKSMEMDNMAAKFDDVEAYQTELNLNVTNRSSISRVLENVRCHCREWAPITVQGPGTGCHCQEILQPASSPPLPSSSKPATQSASPLLLWLVSLAHSMYIIDPNQLIQSAAASNLFFQCCTLIKITRYYQSSQGYWVRIRWNATTMKAVE